MKLTKNEVDSLTSDLITKRDYDATITKIDARFSEIMLDVSPVVRNKGWFDYGNCGYTSEDAPGYFDPAKYKEEIIIGGYNSGLPEPYNYYFPTRWLWENYRSEFDIAVEAHNKKALDKKDRATKAAAKRKAKKAAVRKSIEAKLTAAELKAIEFK